MIVASELLTPDALRQLTVAINKEQKEKKYIIIQSDNFLVWHLLRVMIWQLSKEEEQVKQMG